jgi:colicin import membrane protein
MEHRSESSVVFNLAEIMRLETERVAAEQTAAAEAAEGARRERERQLALAHEEAVRMRARASAREAAEREQALRRERDHHEALLRIRLEAEAAERLEQERLDMEHARALERIALQARRERSRHAIWLLAPVCAVAGAVVTWAALGASAEAPSGPAASSPALRTAGEATNAPSVSAGSVAAAASAERGDVAVPATAGTRGTPLPKSKLPRPPIRRVNAPTPVLDVDTGSDDPLLGILDEPRPTPKARRRVELGRKD